MKLKYVVYALTTLVLIQIYSIYNLRQINKALIEANESAQDWAKMGRILSQDYLISIKSEGYILPEGIILETYDSQNVLKKFCGCIVLKWGDPVKSDRHQGELISCEI